MDRMEKIIMEQEKKLAQEKRVDPTPQVSDESYIKITFQSSGSCLFDLEGKSITPIQILAVAKYMEVMATEDLKEMRQQPGKIVLPNKE